MIFTIHSYVGMSYAIQFILEAITDMLKAKGVPDLARP